jgi:hypothetical protein
MRRSRTVAAVALALALAAGCQSQTPTQPDNLQPDPPEAAHEAPVLSGPQAARFGAVEEAFPWKVTVQQPGWSDQIPEFTEPGFAWLVFQVTWEPLPTANNAVPWAATPSFWVQAGGGEEFIRNYGWQPSRQLILTGLEPGEHASGLISFLVPKGRGKLIMPLPVDNNVTFEWSYTDRGGPPGDGSVAAKTTSEDVGAHLSDLEGRMQSWNELLADVPASQRVPLERWDNYNLLNYLNTYLHDLPAEADGLQPYDGNELTASGVLEDNPSPLFPHGNGHGEQCQLPSGPGADYQGSRPEVYRGDAGDRTRYFWGFVTCPWLDGPHGEPGQRGTQLVHLRIRLFRDSTGLDHAVIRVLKTPPLGDRPVP